MTRINFIKDIKETNIPFIVIPEGEFAGMHFLVDTGATNSVIFLYKSSVPFVKKMKVVPDVSGSVRGLNGVDMKSDYVVAELNFGNGEEFCVFNCVSNKYTDAAEKMEKENGFPMHGIIGVDIMKEYGWVIDPVEQCVYINK